MRIWQWLLLVLIFALGFTVARSETARWVLLWAALIAALGVVLRLAVDAIEQWAWCALKTKRPPRPSGPLAIGVTLLVVSLSVVG
ncbi:MAG TPA: hypothetical protein VGZ22_27980 [Isosphaeraceae bacterium]|jgi:hypothetical protein|nr:hypothetical protein [Isosphaeraceae bacterium]